MKLRSSKETSFSILLPTTRKRKAKENKLKEVPSKKTRFCDSYYRQNWSFRGSFIHYITQNPSSAKVYQKMIQSCKHFFIKNPIIIVPELYFLRKKGWCTQENRPSRHRLNDRSIYLNELSSKIWITDLLHVWGSTPNWSALTSFMPQIYQCDATDISIEKQMFSFNDLMVIASKCETLYLSNVVIMNNDEVVPETEEYCFENAVSLETLFKALPNVKTFEYDLPNNSLNIVTTKTVEELLKIPHFLSLDKFVMKDIPETFDIKSFYDHIKKNKKTKIDLGFPRQISDEYKTQLQTIVDEILETKNRDYKVPYIFLQG
uniref:Uncharacterized protein n=1 Tax=Panagrolaimus davidi TaxID=227884 RepID=A0A914PRU7_9BILA